jgi:hypothetical protein
MNEGAERSMAVGCVCISTSMGRLRFSFSAKRHKACMLD